MAMNKRLHRLGNASASSRDENMFNVFARLNTSQKLFLPGTITQVTTVTTKTLASYLTEILSAQFLETNPNKSQFLQYINQPISQHFFYQELSEISKEQAETLKQQWINSLSTSLTNLSNEKTGRLQQFILNETKSNNLQTLYDRLIWSTIVFSTINKKKKK